MVHMLIDNHHGWMMDDTILLPLISSDGQVINDDKVMKETW
jgi:hypothetical protein